VADIHFSDPSCEHEVQIGPSALLVGEQMLKHPVAQTVLPIGWEADGRQCGVERIVGAGIGLAESLPEPRRYEHPKRHGVAVGQFEMGGALEGMAERVAEVQDLTTSLLTWVRLDDVAFDGDGRSNPTSERQWNASSDGVRIAGQGGGQGRVRNDAVLQQLREPCQVDRLREGV